MSDVMMSKPWDEITAMLREIADTIERQARPAFEVIEAARGLLDVLKDARGVNGDPVVTKARKRLTKALEALDQS